MRLREILQLGGINLIQMIVTDVKLPKSQKLRNNEYYNMQGILDKLYDRSKNGYNFYKLYDLVFSDVNICLAYRNIKRNKGSKTSGTDDINISSIEKQSNLELINRIQHKVSNYKPQSVRRVFIPKPDGSKRPLGIPTLDDRLIQQCMKQILDPICEAKFHPHSYGFRDNRNISHALARASFLINQNKLTYCVDIDIKGFFDNVNHGKLLKQIWTLGIRDKKIISIISKILKSEIKGEGIPVKGTPQGGIISPLLSNIVLNELDWWLSDQWLTFNTTKKYSSGKTMQKSLKDTTNLKEIFHVRYADDFKIFCRTFEDAQKIYIAVKEWLDKRLGLTISETKSKIVNLEKNYSEFLGFRLKAVKEKNKVKYISHITDKSKNKLKEKIRKQIQVIDADRNTDNVRKLNSIILGIHNYYSRATRISDDMNTISHQLNYFLSRKTKNFRSKTGRDLIHKQLSDINLNILHYLMRTPIKNRSVEYNDNRISLYVGQKGKCAICKLELQIGDMHCHHKTPISKNDSDEYSNLILVTKSIHETIHTIDIDRAKATIANYQLDTKAIDKLNKLRLLIGNIEIDVN